MTGLRNGDPFLRDIQAAARMGFFDRREADGPSELELTPVEELMERVSTMSPERRRIYLGQIGRVWGERGMLSGGKRSKRTRLWLSKKAG